MATSRIRQIVHEDAVAPDTLRRFYKVRALNMGISLNDLQAQLGHIDPKATSIDLKTEIKHSWKRYYRFDIS